MANQNLKVIGQDRLLRHLKIMQKPAFLFDRDVKRVATKSYAALKRTNPKDTGQTAKKWTRPVKLADSIYKVTNEAGTQDRKHNIAWILNKGRKAVTPRRARVLYIPLTRKAKKKRLGAKIPKNYKFGVDYVFAKFSKAVRGTKFIDNRIKEATIGLARLMRAKALKVHSRSK